jgi:hypothetical protein
MEELLRSKRTDEESFTERWHQNDQLSLDFGHLAAIQPKLTAEITTFFIAEPIDARVTGSAVVLG